MTIYSGFSHWKWWFSIVMLVYQRVRCFSFPVSPWESPVEIAMILRVHLPTRTFRDPGASPENWSESRTCRALDSCQDAGMNGGMIYWMFFFGLKLPKFRSNSLVLRLWTINMYPNCFIRFLRIFRQKHDPQELWEVLKTKTSNTEAYSSV